MDAIGLLLTTAFRTTISEPNIESGYQRFVAIAGKEIEFGAFCDAVAAIVRDGLVREPVRLPEGALQCHWRLELTSQGVAAARALRAIGDNKQGVREPLVPGSVPTVPD